MTTRLKCGEWKCSKYNSAVENWVDDRNYDQRRKNEPPRASLSNLRCNFHIGVIKRSTYSRRDYFPLAPKDITRLLAEQAKLDEQAREADRERAIEADRRDAERQAEDWAAMDLSASHAVIPDDDRLKEEPTFEGHVRVEGHSENRWDTRWFHIQPSQRHYGRPGRPYPYIIRVTRGASLSPNEARALAAALVEAADKAEELNASRRPA